MKRILVVAVIIIAVAAFGGYAIFSKKSPQPAEQPSSSQTTPAANSKPTEQSKDPMVEKVAPDLKLAQQVVKKEIAVDDAVQAFTIVTAKMSTAQVDEIRTAVNANDLKKARELIRNKFSAEEKAKLKELGAKYGWTIPKSGGPLVVQQ